jgi:hypothetical protein
VDLQWMPFAYATPLRYASVLTRPIRFVNCVTMMLVDVSVMSFVSIDVLLQL